MVVGTVEMVPVRDMELVDTLGLAEFQVILPVQVQRVLVAQAEVVGMGMIWLLPFMVVVAVLGYWAKVLVAVEAMAPDRAEV